jgi:hypothetical protein
LFSTCDQFPLTSWAGIDVQSELALFGKTKKVKQPETTVAQHVNTQETPDSQNKGRNSELQQESAEEVFPAIWGDFQDPASIWQVLEQSSVDFDWSDWDRFVFGDQVEAGLPSEPRDMRG